MEKGFSFEALFGPELVDSNGKTHATAERLRDLDGVLVYFSAHWCPPCRAFTPQFAESYAAMKAAGKKFEAVFVSSDRDQAAFEEYLGEMPWLAVPFSDRDRKAMLSKKYKVRGIPSLVVLDGATGELVTSDGRAEVSADPGGARFPWRPKPLSEVLSEVAELQTASGLIDAKAALAGKTVGLYFSAHWCGPCRGFTPELVKTYNTMKAAGKLDHFEIVFVSSDRDEAAFTEYFGEMPWLALPFADRETKEALSKACGVSGIPHLAIVGPDGTIINNDGRAALAKDKAGEHFPWHPPSYTELEDSSTINEEPTLIAFVEGCSAEVRAAVEAAVKTVAEARAGGAVKFAVAGPGDGLASRVRELARLGEPGTTPSLVLIDLDDEHTFYTAAPAAEYDAGAIEAFTADFIAGGKLERKKLAF